MPQNKLMLRTNQILASVVLFLLIIMPLCLILLKGFVPSEENTFVGNISQLFERYHLKILWNSIVLGISVLILSTVIALPLSFIMTKTTLVKHQWLDMMIMIPFMVPPYIGAMGWMLTMQRNGLLEQISPIFAHITPYFFSFLAWYLL